MRTIFLITVIGFLAGIFIGFGGYFFGGRNIGNDVADINGVKITYRQYSVLFNRIMENLREQNKDINEGAIEGVRREVLQDLIQEEALYQESRKFAIIVTDAEVAFDIQRYPAFQQDGRFNQGVYFQVLAYHLKMLPKEFEEQRRRQISIAKMRNMIVEAVKITEPEIRFEYARRHGNNMKNFEKDRPKFEQEILNEKRTAYLTDWYKSINASLKVKVFEEVFKRG
jgi:peptidyl-prolyl cis-trans isomerase D